MSLYFFGYAKELLKKKSIEIKLMHVIYKGCNHTNV